MANQRGIVAGWDTANSRPKGVQTAADLRASLGSTAVSQGLMYEPGAAKVTFSVSSMQMTWTAFTAVLKSSLGGWYMPRIDAGNIALPVGHATYARWVTYWVKQWDYQTDATHPDSEVQTGLAQGTPSASPVKPTVPTGALACISVLIPKGAATSSDIPLANVELAPWTTPAGGVIPDELGRPLRWNGTAWEPFFTALTGISGPVWESLPLSAGYTAVAGYPLQIAEWNGIIYIRGAVLVGSTGTWDNVASVPEKYRPTQQQFLGGQVASGSSGTTVRVAALFVQTNGKVGVADGYVTAIAGNILPVVGYWFKN